MNFSAVGVAKLVVSGLVGIGTGKIVANVIKNHITPETLIDKVTVTAAAWVIGAIATEATKDYTDELVDTISEAITSVIDKVKTNQKLSRINKGESTVEEEGLDPDLFERDENNVWIVRDPAKNTIDINVVVGMIRTGEWAYDAKKDVWILKDDNGKEIRAFKQNKKPDGTSEWVWGKVAL